MKAQPIQQTTPARAARSGAGTFRLAAGLLLWGAVIVFCILHRDAITVDGILRITPHSTVLAVLMLLCLFAVKSVSVVFYSGILFVASGILFPLPLAIAVNLIGSVIMVTIPYLMGRYFGGEAMERFVSRHRNAQLLYRFRTENTFFCALMIRIINILPLDVVSVYFGTVRSTYGLYLLGSLAGMASSCILYPILGMNITNPRSPQFLISVGIELAIMTGSLVTLFFVRRRTAEAGRA